MYVPARMLFANTGAGERVRGRRGWKGRSVRLYPEEPAAGPWIVEPLVEVVATIVGDWPSERPLLLAIDGRSSAGKTTLSARIYETVAGTVVVHTDDVAWRYSVFGWDELLRVGVLVPARRGDSVSYRPPAWDVHRRPGAMHVPAGAQLVIVEGVGAGRRELASHFDGIIWVQSDLEETLARDRQRVAAGEISPSAYAEWMRQERSFHAEQKTWSRADQIVCGSPAQELPPRQVLVGTRPRSAKL